MLRLTNQLHLSSSPKKNRKLTDWSSDEDTPSSILARSKNNKIVVLEKMFTLKELEEDPTLLLDLKDDVRSECEEFGQVTNVILYDGEEDGIIVVRFKDDLAAMACIAVSTLFLYFASSYSLVNPINY